MVEPIRMRSRAGEPRRSCDEGLWPRRLNGILPVMRAPVTAESIHRLMERHGRPACTEYQALLRRRGSGCHP